MLPSDSLTRLFTAKALIIVTALAQLATSHALPQQTKTVGLKGLQNVVEWPVVETPAPRLLHQLMRRDFNTVCGYIGGDAALPVTCSAGSHCAVDLDHKAVGCCPDGGPCNQGIYTNCVDMRSPPQTVLDPYVYTCTGSDVCYQNNFEGSYSQFGCGSHLATTVAMSAVSGSAIQFSRVAVQLTAKPTPLATPTTIGSPPSTQSALSTASSSASKGSASASSSGAKAGGASSTSSASSTAGTVVAPPAPVGDTSTGHAGAIAGGVVGGVSAAVVVAMVLFYLWHRKENKVPKQYINPSEAEKYENDELRAHAWAQANLSASSPQEPPTERARPESEVPVPPSPSTIGLAVPMSTANDRLSDEIPLRNEGARLDGSITPTSPTGDELDLYPGPRRGGGGSFWSQTRSTGI